MRLTAIDPDSSNFLLGPHDPDPVGVQNAGAASPFVLVCDHAGRAVPRALGALGLPPEAFEAHIAFDIGALALSRQLATRLGAPLIHQTYSRLVIDCNRAPHHPSSIVEVSDGWTIPGNRNLSPDEVQARIDQIHAPYHATIAAELTERQGAERAPLLVCVHSFTPALAVTGARRPWHVGILHGPNSPASLAMLELLGRESGLVVGDNEPYAMDGTDYTAPRHAWDRGADVVEIEVRQDLISDPTGVDRFADLFARLLPRVAGPDDLRADG